MTTATLPQPPAPTAVDAPHKTRGHEPVYAFTAQQIEDLKTDAFRAGYRRGVAHATET